MHRLFFFCYNMLMKIAFLSRMPRHFDYQTLQTESLAETQAALLHLARALAQRGHEVHIFSQTGSQNPSQEGVHFHPVPQLARFARQEKPDVFVSASDELSLKLGIPARITLAWLQNDYAQLWREMPDLRAEFARLFATGCDRVIAASQWQANKLASVFGLPNEHLSVLPNGIEPTEFSLEPTPDTPARLYALSPPEQDLNGLLVMFSKLRQTLPELELHLLKSGVEGEAHSQCTEQLGVYLHQAFTPAQRGQFLAQGSLWLSAQALNQPSPKSGEWLESSSLNLAALQAQAAGLPVVASAQGTLSETVQDGHTGVLIPGEPGSARYHQAFVSACLELLQNPEQRQKMAQKARERALRDFAWSQIAAQWEALLSDFSSTRQNSPPLASPFPTPEISVIIPTYNRARNLKNCLESLTWQDFNAFEVLVCDDGSSDNSREIALAYQDRLNLRYRWQEDLGFRAAAARNLGLQLARGKLLVFLDSDLVVPPRFLSAHRDAHQQAQAKGQKVVVNSYVNRMLEQQDDDLGLPPAEYIPRHRNILKPDSRDRYELFERGTPVAETYFLDSNALSMTRKDLEKVGGFDAGFIGWGHEDTELGYRLAAHGIRLLLLKEGAEAYHQYHYVSELKDEERAVNWRRLAAKHGITKWYHPLWELPVYGLVQLNEVRSEGSPAQLPPILEAGWELKTGHRPPLSNLYYLLEVEDGILKRIRANTPPRPSSTQSENAPD